MSEYFDNLNEMKEMEKHPSKFYSEEEKIARGIYCPKCLEIGNKVEIVPGTATCPRCFCIEHHLTVDTDRFQMEMERNIEIEREKVGMRIIEDIEEVEIGKTYPVNDIIGRIGDCCDMIIGHAIIEGIHSYFLSAKDLGCNGNREKNITLLSLMNKRMNQGYDGNGKEYIRKFILDNGTMEALCRLKVFESNKVYKYVMTDIEEIKSYGYDGMKRDAIKNINDVFVEMKMPYKADNHKKYIKIWRYI